MEQEIIDLNRRYNWSNVKIFNKNIKTIHDLLIYNIYPDNFNEYSNGNEDILYYMGVQHYLCKQYNKAIKYFRIIVEKEQVERSIKGNALNNLGYMCIRGFCEEYCKNGYDHDKKSIEFYNEAISFGSDAAMNNLGRIYYFGDGVERDGAKANELFLLAVKTNNDNTSALHKINFKNYDIAWETYLHERWPNNATLSDQIMILLLISKHRNSIKSTKKINFSCLVFGITKIIIRHLAAYKKNDL